MIAVRREPAAVIARRTLLRLPRREKADVTSDAFRVKVIKSPVQQT